MEMSKKLILGLALAVVIVSGSFFNVQAECGFGCLPHISLPSCLSCAKDMDRQPAKDLDKPDATCRCAYQPNPATPDPMGSPSAY
jgi:hypothetical protein